MQRSGSGLKTQKSQKRTKGLRSNSNVDEVHSSCCERCFDYIITGDFSGLYRGAKKGIVTFFTNLSERYQNFQKWFAVKRKEQEQRAMDKTIEHPYPRIRKIVHTNCFEIVGNLVIFANTFVVGWQAELLPHTVTDRDKLVSTILENFFTFAFVVELTLSTLCWGWTSLLERENWMDVFLVFLGVLTTWILGPFGIEVDFLRKLTALRTLRLIRLARAVRLRPEFKEMWALMKGLTDSGETLFWTYVMIFCVLYFFAIIATSLIGKEDEYLSSTGCDELLFTRLPHASVVTAKDRPAQAVVEKADRWRQQLGRVEELSQRFRSLRNACNKLAAQSAGPLPRDPLQGLADQLAALRSESEARMADLLGAAEARASAGGGINEQLTSSTEGFQVEIDSMHQEQQALQSRLKQLQAERQDVLKKLQALDEEIAVATSAYQASTQRERQVRASQKRVAGELKRELSIEEVEARKVGDRQRLLMEATAASKDIEGLLESRTETAKARLAAWEQLGERQAKAQGVCLQSEKERARACEELLAGWHAAVWGPDAQELSQDPTALATLRALHGRSSSSLQQAWKDTVQLAAECLGEDGSEELSRAAERYKAMLKEIKSNLDRMKVLEAASRPAPRSPAGRAPNARSTETVEAASAQSGTTSEAVPSPAAVPQPAAAAAQPEAVPEAGAAQEEDEAE